MFLFLFDYVRFDYDETGDDVGLDAELTCLYVSCLGLVPEPTG